MGYKINNLIIVQFYNIILMLIADILFHMYLTINLFERIKNIYFLLNIQEASFLNCKKDIFLKYATIPSIIDIN